MTQRYLGKTVAFLNQHGKEALVAPLLEPVLGCKVVRAQGYDTDLLGTFAGNIQRRDTQLQTARQKARMGMALAGTSQGLGSEGSFVPDPFGGMMPWNIEMLVWIDDEQPLEIVGLAQGPARSQQQMLHDASQLEGFALKAGFPEHHLLLRPHSATDTRVIKGLHDWAALHRAFDSCQRMADNQLVYAENDHRAFCNPTRQSMIRLAANDLLKKITSTCPECHAPGFSVVQHQAGLPCRDCKLPTRLASAYVWACSVCHHTREEPAQVSHAPSQHCDVCNP